MSSDTHAPGQQASWKWSDVDFQLHVPKKKQQQQVVKTMLNFVKKRTINEQWSHQLSFS